MALHRDNIHLTQVNKNFFLSTKGRTFWPRGFWNNMLTGGVAKTRGKGTLTPTITLSVTLTLILATSVNWKWGRFTEFGLQSVSTSIHRDDSAENFTSGWCLSLIIGAASDWWSCGLFTWGRGQFFRRELVMCSSRQRNITKMVCASMNS